MSRLPKTIFVVLLLLGLSGCRNSVPPEFPKLYPCRVTVIQDDHPLEDAIVSFHNADGQQQWTLMGRTKADGVAEMRANGRFSGVPAGVYKVQIFRKIPGPSKLPPAPPLDDPGYEKWKKKSDNEILDCFLTTEELYYDVATTPLEIELPQKKKVPLVFNIGKKIHKKL